MAGEEGERWRVNTLNIEYTVFCMEPAKLPIVFAHIPSMGLLEAAPLGRLLFGRVVSAACHRG